MSPIASADTATRLAQRTRQYCNRAQALVRDPSLTMAEAAHALDHLARLRDDLTDTRIRETSALQAEIRRIEAPITRLESALTHALAELSEALLHAIPCDSPHKANLYGPVPHGMQPDDAINQSGNTTPTPPQAISVCRSLLDLEALRPHFSGTALREAIERHGKHTRSHTIAGVAYAHLPPSAHLPCNIL